MRSIVEFLKSMSPETSGEHRPTAEQPGDEPNVVTLADRRRAAGHPPAERPDDSDPGPTAA